MYENRWVNDKPHHSATLLVYGDIYVMSYSLFEGFVSGQVPDQATKYGCFERVVADRHVLILLFSVSSAAIIIFPICGGICF